MRQILIKRQTTMIQTAISIVCFAVFVFITFMDTNVYAETLNNTNNIVGIGTSLQEAIEIINCESVVTEEITEYYESVKITMRAQKQLPIIQKPLDEYKESSIVTEEFVEQEIDENFDILTPCGYTQAELEYAVSDHRRDEMLQYVDTFLEAEELYGVNALYLMSKFGLESGWCKYESGNNNIGGWTNIRGEFMDFESVDHCILYIAEKLSTNFKDDVGTKLKDVCARYNTSDDYLDKIISIMKSRQDVIEDYRAEIYQ